MGKQALTRKDPAGYERKGGGSECKLFFWVLFIFKELFLAEVFALKRPRG